MRTPFIPHEFGEPVERFLRSRSGWVSAAVAASIPWPGADVWIKYAGDDFVLRGTGNGEQRRAPCITVPGSRNEIEGCLGRIYRLTSVLGWFRDGYVDVVDVVSGSRPISFGALTRHASACTGAWGDRSFDCNYMPLIEDDQVRIALAFWREGERLHGVHDAYSFLSYFKVIESQYREGRDREQWFNENIEMMTDDAACRVAQLRANGEDVGLHLWNSGRNAVAHASFGRGIVDPDIPADRRRISADLVLMRELAKRYIAIELGVPTSQSLHSSRNRLAPWEQFIDPVALLQLQKGGTPDARLLGLNERQLGLALWPDAPVDGLSNMVMYVDAVHEGHVRILVVNERMTIKFVFVLDFRHGRVHTQLDDSSLMMNSMHSLIEQDVRDFYYLFHRVIGNAAVELRVPGCDPVDCEVVIPVNIIPRNPEEAIEEAVEAFRFMHGTPEAGIPRVDEQR